MPRLILPGSYQSISKTFLPPDTDGLEYWGFFGADDEFSGRNHAPGKGAAVIVGAPVYSPNFARFTPGSNYVNTPALQTADITIVAVARPTVDGYTYIASSNSGPTVTPPPSTTRGVTLRFETGASADGKVSLAFNQSVRDGDNVDQESAATRTLASVVGEFSFAVGRCNAATGARTARDITNDTTAGVTSAFPVNLGANRIIVGGAYTVTPLFQNAVDIAMCAVFSTSKSDDELMSIYARMKSYFSNRGIQI